MKIGILVLLLAINSTILLSQNDNNYTAMILSLSGDGIVQRGSNEIPISLPQRYYTGDKITVKNGSARVMLFTGKEVSIDAVSNYTIPPENIHSTTALFEMANAKDAANSLLSQSGVAYSIRGSGSVHLFPVNSKIINKENLILYHDSLWTTNSNIGIQVIHSITQKVIYEGKVINDSIISLTEIPFESGNSYYWKLNNTPNRIPLMGTIIFPKEYDLPQSSGADLSLSHFEHINEIIALFNQGYLFDAYSLAGLLANQFPAIEIYSVLKKNMRYE